MITVPGYTIVDLLFIGTRSTVYRGYTNRDIRPVAIKIFNKEYPSKEDLAKIRREYEIAKALDYEGIVQAIDLIPFQQSYAIILEDFGGRALNSIIAENKIDLLSCMQISLRLTETLGILHQKGIIHKDIKPSNIIINKETLKVKLTDFSIASRIFGEKQERVDPDLLEGTLSYISPEQTGRMNRSIDNRSDLYSLGIMMYEMLTGSLPFTATNVLELIHCHMAVQPKPPREHNTDIPQTLSDIVIKLLAKNAEERYRSAFGLRHDLEKCLVQFNESGIVEQFILGTRDIPTTLQIPEKLYGRDDEFDELMNAFSRVCLGNGEMIIVSGAPGIGKSVLINELYKPVIEQKGYFVSGKFDQFKRDVPYNALRQAFQELSLQLLSEQVEKISGWKKKVQNALGPNAQIIIDLIPKIELIIGKQPPVEPLPPTQSQNRFNMVFTEFVKVFACREHPLVLFLDDVQWADWATLKLVELLISSPDIKYLLLVGAYRDNEVDRAHPLMLTVDEIAKTGISIRDIRLNPLTVNGIIELITDTLVCPRSPAENLADVVMTKTHGNPFFINQFLRNLYRRQMILFDSERYSWVWDIATIRSADITSNVVEFMCERINQLLPETRNTLAVAACIGNKFNLDLLARVSNRTIADTEAALRESQKEGLLVPMGVRYKYNASYIEEGTPVRTVVETKIPYLFFHDRIRQAAYSLISEDQKKSIHYQVANIMMEKTPAADREEKIFEVVQHFNMGADLLVTRDERIKVAGLNLKASRKAKAANAYETALQFAGKGLTLIEQNNWDDDYKLIRNLSMEKAECNYLVGNFSQAEKILADVLENVRSNEEIAQVYDLKTIIYALGNLMESVRSGLNGLHRLGISVTENPSNLRVALEFGKAFLRLRGRKPGTLLSLSEVTDSKQQLTIRIIMNTISSAYLINKKLFEFLCLKGFNHTLKYGVTESSPYMLMAYAFALADNFSAYKNAYDFGEAAFPLNERLPNAQMRSKITAMFGFFFSHWRRPLQEGINMVKKGFSYCVETGDLVFAGYSACTLVIYMLAQGRNIDELLAETETYENFITRAEDQFSIDWYTLKNQLIKCLKGQTGDKSSLSDNEFDEARAVQGYRDQHNANLLFHFCSWKGLVLYLNGELDEAYMIFNEAKQYEHGVALLPSVGDCLFYHTLVMTALYPLRFGREHWHIRRILNNNRIRLKKWMINSPATFRHKYLLVEAEIAKNKGKKDKAIDLYSRAIESAREHGFLQVEALANELMARFHFSFNRESIGQVYIREACRCYHKWGATAKVHALAEKYGLIYSMEYPRFKSLIEEAETPPEGIRQIDLATVLRASQSISEEIVLSKLLQEIMHIVIQNAGAQKGFLVLEKDGSLFIEAEGYTEKEEVKILQSIPVESSQELCVNIVNYVKRTMETVVLNSAFKKGLFVSDPYVIKNQSKSILCIPIIKQSKLTGILYLENNLLMNAFTPDRCEVLYMIAAQAAISLENAKLYEKIKSSLKEKDVLLREIHHRVKNNIQIISSLLRLQSRQFIEKKDVEMLKDSQSRIQSMSLIHEKLYQSKDLANIDFGYYVKELTNNLMRVYEVNSEKIKFKINIKDIFFGIDTAIPCGLIINELVTNSLKYAFPEGREGEIKVIFHKTNEDEIELIISDNGIGISEGLDFRNTESLGLHIVTTLSEHQLQGKIELYRTQGTEFHIRFKEINK